MWTASKLAGWIFMALALMVWRSVAHAEFPNIVFILADDLGWSDTTLYGQTRFYRTPNLERLAQRGMRFTRAYSSSPLCSPTRASILTGLSPARHGITAPNCHLPEVVLRASAEATAAPGKKAVNCRTVTRLDTNYVVLPEILKQAGYVTAHFGKWHLGSEPYSPLQQGFDTDVPHWPGPGPAGSFVAPWRFPGFKEKRVEEHIEDRMAEEAVAFIRQHRHRPFFLNYWQFSVHAPFNAKPALIEAYRGRIDPADAQRSATYAAMVQSMDEAVGALLDALDEQQIAERTIIVFTSDNGGNMYDQVDGTTPTSNRPLRGGKATVYEGGVRVPCVIVYPPLVRAGSQSDTPIQSIDFAPTLLDLAGVRTPRGQRFDGVSLRPVLRGKSLRRDALFTYFPHDPPVPDWLPPSVSMLENDWKLIRIFHGGEGETHRYKLFHLSEDEGEQRDLAAQEPKRVARMDRRIQSFLNETRAVVPVPNPRFDPAAYRPDQEGKPAPRQASRPSGAREKKAPVRQTR
jgi:arylsulfatase A-like enzyme